MKEELKKANDDNQKILRDVLDLKNSSSKFKKGKETFDSLLESRRFYGNTHGLGYSNKIYSLSSSDIKFVKGTYDSCSSTSQHNEI